MEKQNLASAVLGEMQKAVIGKEEEIKKIFCAIIAGGHVLIEDIPGLGKTTMAKAFSQLLGLKTQRMQFTPDVLPSDVVGFNLLDKKTQEMKYMPGAVFCNLFLADEINRTSPKTQSALLEVMEEGKVSVDGITRDVEKPFIVVATQNPCGSAGTQLLPDSQMDRFMICLSLGYPNDKEEMDIIKLMKALPNEKEIEPIMSAKDILKLQESALEVFMHDAIYKYIVSLVQATRQSALIEQGASPRASIALAKMAAAYALIHGRDYVIPEDVLAVFREVVAHRIIMNSKAKMKHLTKEDILQEIINQVKAPRMVS